jgi:peptidylprolyl isomerase
MANRREHLARARADGKLRSMHAPSSRMTTLALSLALALAGLAVASCERGGAPAAPPPAPMSVSDAGRPEAPSAVPIYFMPPPADLSMPPADAEREPSGVARKILKRGSGPSHPPPDAFVDLVYAGWERNGRQFEGMGPNTPPNRYDLKELCPGLSQEIQQMAVGDKRRIWVPAALAYAKRTDFANAPKGDMTFEVELMNIVPRATTPADLKAPPKDAKTTKSGLTYVVLTKGKGKRHPADETRAEVVYTGWTPDGRMFQTSVASQEPAIVRVRMLPPGWKEAMKLMVEGDKWRLWLTGKLGFGELAPGAENLPFGMPSGPIVYDVELVRIVE